MKKSGFDRPFYKRTMTPADRHKHVCVYHHPPYVLHYPVVHPETEPVKQVEEPVVEEKKPEEKKSRRQVRREIKKAQEEDLIRRRAGEPEISTVDMLIRPAKAMEAAASSEEITMSRGNILVLHLLKWMAVGICFAGNIRHFINYESFSIVSMSFTEAAGIAVKMAGFCFVMDIICSIITYALIHAFDSHFSFIKMHAVRARYYLMQTAGYLIAAFIAVHSNTAGIVLITLMNVLSIMLRFHSYQLTTRCSTEKQLLVICLNLILSVSLFLEFGHYAFGNVEEILMYILNI